jgi:predicted CopG family antitoxin
MSTTLQTVKETVVAKKERRARQIRITEKTYNELAKLGDVTDDFEDVIARLLKHYKETKK